MRTANFPIIKVSATGNDFLLIDLLSDNLKSTWAAEFGHRSRNELARLWCNRHEALGADGMVFLQSDPKLDFVWDFYNCDGGQVEMCGNAARAVSLYVHQTYNKSHIKFATKVGEVEAQVRSATDIEVTLPAIAQGEWNLTTQSHSANQTPVHFDFVRAGVPHAVTQVTNIDDRPALRTLALTLKNEPRFKSEGINVTFVSTTGSGVKAITFERGVEDFTLSCGTGAVAAAHSILRGNEERAIAVHVPGGQLSVIWKRARPHLSGPAKIVAEMRVIKGE